MESIVWRIVLAAVVAAITFAFVHLALNEFWSAACAVAAFFCILGASNNNRTIA